MVERGDDVRRGTRAAIVSTARALKAVIAAGRRELGSKGRVSQGTWDAIDELTESLNELLPDDERRRF